MSELAAHGLFNLVQLVLALHFHSSPKWEKFLNLNSLFI